MFEQPLHNPAWARERARLHWRCRRGMRELDLLLERWLEQHWADADAERRLCFEQLLDTEDDRLWSWLTGRARPPSTRLAKFVDELLDDPARPGCD